MKKICIQIGHLNISTNCILSLRGGTGAPLEVTRNTDIGNKLAEILRQSGNYDITVVDANYNCDKNCSKTDYDLFLSLHCDANYEGNDGGGFVDYIDPTADSSATSNAESKRLKEAIESVYFAESGIRNVPQRSNPNTRFYYMWQYLSENTHFVIIEMGESIDPHDNVILNDIPRVANAIKKGIDKAYGFITQTPQVPNDELNKCKLNLENAKTQITALDQDKNNLAVALDKCQQTSRLYKDEYDKASGYKEQIALLEDQKKTWIGKEQQYIKDYQSLTTKYNNLKKPGLKFIQDCCIKICEKLGVNL